MNKSLFVTQNTLLLFMFVLLLIFFKGPNLLYASLAFFVIAVYHLLTDSRFSYEQMVTSGLMGIHLGVYLLLCSVLIWATTGEEESNYWIIYFLPIIVAATHLNLLKTLVTSFFSSVFYLLLIPQSIWLDPLAVHEELPEFLITCTTFFIVGVVIQGFSHQSRAQLEQEQQLNEQLVEKSNALHKSLLQLEATEETLRRKDRLAALGEMSAGLAHEIRNPLGMISSSAQLLHQQLHNAGQNHHQLLEVIREESRRLNGMVNDFLQFGRPSEPKCEQQDLACLLQRVVQQLTIVAQESEVQLSCVLPAEAIPVYVDSAMVQQMLLNLLLNALDACSAGGEVTLNLSVDEHQVNLSISDSGCGIEPQMMATIFNPFVTTKESGTGLGLAIAHSIAVAHGGDISVRSRVDYGSCFTVTLPLEEN
ncbi:MAG: ATP-binding protein [Desulfuromonas sp.]|nr:ATP-binding protein [Desulfuromonas sp.]